LFIAGIYNAFCKNKLAARIRTIDAAADSKFFQIRIFYIFLNFTGTTKTGGYQRLSNVFLFPDSV